MPGRAGGVAPGGRTATHTESTLYLRRTCSGRRMTQMGHLGLFLLPSPSVGCGFGSRSFAQNERCGSSYTEIRTLPRGLSATPRRAPSRTRARHPRTAICGAVVRPRRFKSSSRSRHDCELSRMPSVKPTISFLPSGSPAQFTDAGFVAFNRHYVERLAAWGFSATRSTRLPARTSARKSTRPPRRRSTPSANGAEREQRGAQLNPQGYGLVPQRTA